MQKLAVITDFGKYVRVRGPAFFWITIIGIALIVAGSVALYHKRLLVGASAVVVGVALLVLVPQLIWYDATCAPCL